MTTKVPLDVAVLSQLTQPSPYGVDLEEGKVTLNSINPTSRLISIANVDFQRINRSAMV
jgi:hypothetical protein